MLSPAQLAANAANARHSTGPRTPEGKAHSSQNARKHGLTARDVVFRDDQREEFEELAAGFHADLQPQGALEQELVDHLIVAAWRLRCARRALAGRPGASTEAYERYETRAERAFHRCLRELRALQTNRALLTAFRPQLEEAGLHDVGPLASIVEWTKRTQRPALAPAPRPVTNGSAFSYSASSAVSAANPSPPL
jgi:hypothetical protein